MVIKSKVGAARTRRAVSWEIVPSCLVETLSIFILIGLLVSCGGGGEDPGLVISETYAERNLIASISPQFGLPGEEIKITSDRVIPDLTKIANVK